MKSLTEWVACLRNVDDKCNWRQKVRVRLAPNPITKFTKLPDYQFVFALGDSHLCGDALGYKRFNHVAFLYVIEVLEINTALHAVANFAGVVFEALQ
jgi:hypothetical protein